MAWLYATVKSSMLGPIQSGHGNNTGGDVALGTGADVGAVVEYTGCGVGYGVGGG